jgi:hypothetical protein
MKLNIKINRLEPERPKTIPVSKLAVGTVYEVANGVIMLKIEGGYSLILTFSTRDYWLELGSKEPGGFAKEPATKILGQLTGIEVTPE